MKMKLAKRVLVPAWDIFWISLTGVDASLFTHSTVPNNFSKFISKHRVMNLFDDIAALHLLNRPRPPLNQAREK